MNQRPGCVPARELPLGVEAPDLVNTVTGLVERGIDKGAFAKLQESGALSEALGRRAWASSVR
ncbi:MAG TPA: hypothetical protein VGF87_08965 [Acidimicrobiales bacterium]|jgi:hypothetical protein